MTIVEFLEARLAEDERIAKATGEDTTYGFTWPNTQYEVRSSELIHIRRHDPERALREVDAKRKIVDGYKRSIRGMGGPATGPNTAPMLAATSKAVCDSIHSLAAIYSDHPDYRKEWATN